MRAALLGQNGPCWDCARAIAHEAGLGEFGREPGREVAMNVAHDVADPAAVFSMLELFAVTGDSGYLEGAHRAADNICTRHASDGWFLNSPESRRASIDSAYPLALLAVVCATKGELAKVPSYIGGGGSIHGAYQHPGGEVECNMYDQMLYA